MPHRALRGLPQGSGMGSHRALRGLSQGSDIDSPYGSERALTEL